MRMIVAGGGTGGHLFPGLAVAECAAAAGAEALFVGGAAGIEARVIPQTRFAFRALDVHGVRGRGARGLVQLAWQLPVALVKAWRIVGNAGADLVLGVGGYASVPVVLAAWLRGLPSVLLEQNAHPGMANRLLARFARRVCTAFPDTRGFFPPRKVVVTGNPVRQFAAASPATGGGFTLLVFGGSQGAHRLNAALHDAAPRLRAAVPALRIIHQTGRDDCEWIGQRYAACGIPAEVRPFIDDMGAAYGQADLVVCRAGATTLAELTAIGKPAVLVPYPFAADDHQRANASVLEAAGAARMILDRDLTGDRVTETVVALARDREQLEAMGGAARRLGKPDAAARVVAVCWAVVEEVRAYG
jgi:UDP-N-acetylglucosamine--N-acetylmuramyl-(pentapeptide) pyrophosphoryl-undecaprenol N-acetylglucosamine transferase